MVHPYAQEVTLYQLNRSWVGEEDYNQKPSFINNGKNKKQKSSSVVSESRSVMPDCLRSHGLQPTRLLCPWDFPGKDTGVGCHFLLQGIFPTQGSNLGLLPCRQILYWLSYKGSRVHGILQARILEWVAFPFSRGSSQPRDWIQVSHIAGGFFTSWATREAQEYWSGQPFSSPVDLPDPGIEPGSPALQVDSWPTELWGKTSNVVWELSKFKTNPLNPVTGFLYFTVLLIDGK